MAYNPIYDGTFDLAIEGEVTAFLESVFKYKLVLVGWVTDGLACGNPTVTIRGTRRQIVGWLNGYYDRDACAFLRANPETGEDLGDADVWKNVQEVFNIAFVA